MALLPGASTKAGSKFASDWKHKNLGRALGATAVSALLGSVNSDYMVRIVV